MNRTENENGFTLIEMMIVLLIISVLILVAIPNVTKHSQSIDEKGCEAYKNIIAMKNNHFNKPHRIKVYEWLSKELIDLAHIIAQ